MNRVKRWGAVVLMTLSVSVTAEQVPLASVELAVPVSGVVQKVLVESGDSVEAGQLLLQLDPRRFEIRLRGAEAALQEMRVELGDAQRNLLNEEDLFERMVTTENALRLARQAVERIHAKIGQREAIRDEAALNLEFCALRAPQAGVIVERRAEPGEVVSSAIQPPVLLILGVASQ